MASKGKKQSEETKRKISLSHIGMKHTEESKQLISKNNWIKKNPDKHPMLGKKRSKETCKKIGLGRIGKYCGKNSPSWKDGISKIDKLCRMMSEYKQWRSDVFSRDNWTCQTCSIRGVYVTAHHIKGFNKIIKENKIKDILMARKCMELWDIDNGVTLCEDCHSLTDNYKGRANCE